MRSFPPQTPPLRPVSPSRCSSPSLVLRPHPTPHRRSCGPCGLGLCPPDCSLPGQSTMRSLVLEIGFSCMQFLSVPGVYDYVGSQLGLAIAPSPVWPSPCIHKVGIPVSTFRSSIPSPLMPRAYASTTASRPPPQDSRSGGSLLLSCRTLSFPTACRFIPALGCQWMAPNCGPELRISGWPRIADGPELPEQITH